MPRTTSRTSAHRSRAFLLLIGRRARRPGARRGPAVPPDPARPLSAALARPRPAAAPGPTSARWSWPATPSSMSSSRGSRHEPARRDSLLSTEPPGVPGPACRGPGNAGAGASARRRTIAPAGARGRGRRRKAIGLPARLPRARAKSVICLFQHGGPSQMDLFDPKPALTKHHGKPYPGKLEIHFNNQAGNVLASPFRFRPQGQSGMVLSELLPHTGRDRRRPDAGPLDDHRVGRSRGGPPADPHRQDPRRPADLGLVGDLRPGHREPQPAGLRGPVRPRRPARRRRAQLVQRLAAGHLPGDAVPLRGDAGAQPGDAPGRHGRGPRRPAAVPRRAEPGPPEPASRQLRAGGADHQLRDRRRRCRRPSPRPSTSPASRRRSAGCTAWTTRPRASTARAA